MRLLAYSLLFAASQFSALVAIADLGPLPDPAWGGAGGDSTVYTGFNLVANAYDRGATSSLVQPDGKLVMTGLALAVASSTQYDVAVVRLNASDGSPDASFGGGDGRLNLNLVSSTIRSARVARDPSARLMISAGQTVSSAVLLRLDEDGALDPNFDQDGRKFVSAGNFLDGAGEITDSPIVLPQSDGKYLVFATVYRQGPPLLMCIGVIRLNANGSIDPSFAAGTGRICKAPPYETLNAARVLDVATSSQGDLLIAGAAYHTGSAVWDMSVLKLSTDGLPDSTFGEDGWAFVPFDEGGNLIDYANAIRIDEQGRILIGGAVSVGTFEQAAAIARLSSNGQIDGTFAQSGKVVLDLGPITANSVFSVTQIVINNPGRILLGGTAEEGSFLAMVNTNGTFDPQFGSEGRFISPRATSADMQWLGDFAFSVGSGTNPASNRTEFAASRRIIPLFRGGFEPE